MSYLIQNFISSFFKYNLELELELRKAQTLYHSTNIIYLWPLSPLLFVKSFHLTGWNFNRNIIYSLSSLLALLIA